MRISIYLMCFFLKFVCMIGDTEPTFGVKVEEMLYDLLSYREG